MSKQYSQFESPRQYDILLQNCLLKCLSSAQKVLQNQIAKALRKKIQQICLSKELITQAIEYFIFTLIGCIENLRQKLSLFQQKQKNKKNNNSSQQNNQRQFDLIDYQNLQQSIQKAQGDIRKHIRLQQQMRIYMNDLQDKVQALQKQLTHESKRFQELFKNLQIANSQNRQLQSKLKRILNNKHFIQNRKNQILQNNPQQSTKPSKIMSEASLKDDFNMYRSSVDKNDINHTGYSLSKKKNLIQKINQRSRKLSKKQHSNNLLYVDSSIHVNLQHHQNGPPYQDKNNSFDAQIKDNIKTVQLHEQVKKPARSSIRFQTQNRQQRNQKKHQRSTSVLQ